ncbi:Pleckstrin homology domain-containing protein [Exophiala viscosa]|uniref:Pleckstrin homology domain-containing protein n=1 Tax=Exophiala viscosa TaxID=2486360 RepID=A0AAN6IF07_9EURO|nr:Pleckstrin homology domain-containing protein [Exophiala viscosa]
MSTSQVLPVGTLTTTHDIDALNPDSYTAHRLKHASPEHLHLTSRRFFIGPIPEGWLNSNRKSWYRRRLELSTYSSKQASFDAAVDDGPHHRTMTGLGGPSTAARMAFSFPQPEDVNNETSSGADADEVEEPLDEEDVIETTDIEPVATAETTDVPRIVGIEEHDETGHLAPKAIPVPADKGINGAGDTKGESSAGTARSHEPESFSTAREHALGPSTTNSPLIEARRSGFDTDQEESDGQGLASFTRHSNVETSSRTALLPPGGGTSGPKSLRKHDPAPMEDDSSYQVKRSDTGVRFKVSEGVQQGRRRMESKAGRAMDRVAHQRMRRNTLKEGTIVKMERMLVRCDITMQPVPEDFDENESQKLELRLLEKWREYMVVVRKSKQQDIDDFRMQIYKTRVIPEIDTESTKKRPQHEIRLDPKTTKVNLYSSLDKTLVIWHPYKRGTRIFVMRPTSTAHSVEWYTFLRDAIGWQRPSVLNINVPDLSVVLKLERPFEELETAGLKATDEQTALAQTLAAEKAVAGKIISQCIEMLEGDPEWSSVLKHWNETAKMGLAWKRYDRLEWVYGANEQKMYGSVALQRSHDLELRPKHHYPTSTHGRKGKLHDEPPPIEGFLIRLTSQKGVSQRFGKAFFKRLYFSTHDQFLMFNRPAKATPPHPPRLATISGSDVPSSQEIIEKTPAMFDVEPYKLTHGDVAWLASGNKATMQSHDREAVEEARRNVANILDSDGFINVCNVRKVRPINRGSSPADDTLDAGSDSDVDFHQDVSDTRAEDGTTKQIDDERIFEIELDNGLVIRLQAYSKQTRDEWINRLRHLVKYWKLRTAAEMDTYKAIRRANLQELNIDEELEAIIGQFAKKWEVSHSQASPELYNMCGISSCRSITMAGSLYLKTRRRTTFHRSHIVLTGGKLLIYQATLRKRTGEQVRHIHQEKQQAVDLKDCYVYSGLIVDDDLLYQNKTFDANHPGIATLPRVYLEDGWTSADVDVMTCFVVWMNRKKGWFRTAAATVTDVPSSGTAEDGKTHGRTRARLRRVGQLGVPGRGMVFKCRSRAERDRWVLSVASEIEKVVEQEAEELGDEGEFRYEK